MQQNAFTEYKQQCSKVDIAFFDLLKSIVDISACENTLSACEIEHLAVGARALNGLIARQSSKRLAQLV